MAKLLRFSHTCPRLVIVAILSSVLLDGRAATLWAEDAEAAKKLVEEAAKERKEQYLNWMRKYSEETKIRKFEAGKPIDLEHQLGELFPNPIFRYSDEERFIPDATLWVWTKAGRPVAFQKVEGNNWGNGQAWTICFASLSEGLMSVDWSKGHRFQSSKPGVDFGPIPETDPPAATARLRVSQIKTLKDRFTARLNVNTDETAGAECRIMPKALFEYSDPETKLPVGAIFGMTSTGTNPDVLLLIEARPDGDKKLRWEYAFARLTSGSIRARLDNEQVWSQKSEEQGSHENWIYYFMRRDFK